MQEVRTPPSSGREEPVTCFVNLQQLRAIETNRLSQLLPSSVALVAEGGVCVCGHTLFIAALRSQVALTCPPPAPRLGDAGPILDSMGVHVGCELQKRASLQV